MRLFHRFLVASAAIVALHMNAAAQSAASVKQKFPDVIAVKIKSSGVDAFDFDATISSPYDTRERYADAFRVIGKDDKVYGERILLHDHADEQPFTRDLYGVKIPRDVKAVTIQGRDKQYGYGGKTFEAQLPGR